MMSLALAVMGRLADSPQAAEAARAGAGLVVHVRRWALDPRRSRARSALQTAEERSVVVARCSRVQAAVAR